MTALSEANYILGLFELPEEDRPPEEYYGNDEMLNEWFEAVKLRRTGGGSDDVEVPMTKNEAVQHMRGER